MWVAMAPPSSPETRSSPRDRVAATRKSSALSASPVAINISFPWKPNPFSSETTCGTWATLGPALPMRASPPRKIRMLPAVRCHFMDGALLRSSGSRERLPAPRVQLPHEQAKTHDDHGDVEAQDEPGHAAGGPEQPLSDPSDHVRDGIEGRLGDEHPHQRDRPARSPAQRDDRERGQDRAADVTRYDLVSPAVGDREAGVLSGDGLEGDVAEHMDPEQRGQRSGTSQTLEPWCHVPDGHRHEHRETGRLGERLRSLRAHGRASADGRCLRWRTSRPRPTLESVSSTISGRSTARLSWAGPSTTMPRIRPAVAAPMIVITNHRPARWRRAETRQPRVMSAKPSGNAPKPTRMFVTAAGEPSEILKAAAVATGLVRYFTAISEKMIVAANSTNRLSHGTT